MDNKLYLIDIFDTVLTIFNIGDDPYAFSKTVTKAIRDINNSKMLSLPFITFVEKDGTDADEFTDSEDIDYSLSYILTNELTGNLDNPDERKYDCISFFEGPFIDYIAYLSSIKLVEFDERIELKNEADYMIGTYLNTNNMFKEAYRDSNRNAISSLTLPSYTPKLKDSSGGTVYYVEEE